MSRDASSDVCHPGSMRKLEKKQWFVPGLGSASCGALPRALPCTISSAPLWRSGSHGKGAKWERTSSSALNAQGSVTQEPVFALRRTQAYFVRKDSGALNPSSEGVCDYLFSRTVWICWAEKGQERKQNPFWNVLQRRTQHRTLWRNIYLTEHANEHMIQLGSNQASSLLGLVHASRVVLALDRRSARDIRASYLSCSTWLSSLPIADTSVLLRCCPMDWLTSKA